MESVSGSYSSFAFSPIHISNAAVKVIKPCIAAVNFLYTCLCKMKKRGEFTKQNFSEAEEMNIEAEGVMSRAVVCGGIVPCVALLCSTSLLNNKYSTPLLSKAGYSIALCSNVLVHAYL
ncbi:MAG TPA: hypothetical protein PL045_08675 [Chitinophagaceae bacterium]|nr:hypothetical protein [Chitinophagaceae bacterium]